MLKTIFACLAIAATMTFLDMPDVRAAEMGYAPQISDMQSIKITVVPPNARKSELNWEFEVSMESHTQDLSDDLVKSSVLIVGGKQYQPISWNGAPPGGHHRKGMLRFKAIAPMPPSMELQIHLANDAAPRSFIWLLK